METLTFEPVVGSGLIPGLVFRPVRDEEKYLRLTHVFDNCVYTMWVGKPAEARYAQRPQRMALEETEKLAELPGSAWGHLALPQAFVGSPLEGSERDKRLKAAMELIQPLVTLFESEYNISRFFTPLIRKHAETTQTDLNTLRRLLLRYYYFGRTRLALLPLPRGALPGATYGKKVTDEIKDSRQPSRRGRQEILTIERGLNKFVVEPDDIEDMIKVLRSNLRNTKGNLTDISFKYIQTAFKARHPDLYEKYARGASVRPVTRRQFIYYTEQYAHLENALAENLRSHKRNPGHQGTVGATGPGEVYEIDGTGGRLYLVSTEDPPAQIGKPWLYIIIDRWSRFVVAVYLSLRPPSYEEVRYALLIAFTSRERRFQFLNVDIDDQRWPRGRIPAVLCQDRGSEFMSESMKNSVVENLRIEMTSLPPYLPDGKAIVERFIRTLKKMMTEKGIKGNFADRPLDPLAKKAAKKAATAAVHSLSEAYAKLIEIVISYNNEPHSGLKLLRSLAQENVPPTPQQAYLWGLKNITGIRSAPFTDADYQRMLLSSDTASLGAGILRYKTRPYLPDNEIAVELARKSTTRAKSIAIKLDKTDPQEVWAEVGPQRWALFRMTSGAVRELHGLDLEEEEALRDQRNILNARAKDEAERQSLNAKKSVTAKRSNVEAEELDGKQKREFREQETANQKAQLIGKHPLHTSEKVVSPPHEEDWKKRAEDRQRFLQDEIRKLRSKP